MAKSNGTIDLTTKPPRYPVMDDRLPKLYGVHSKKLHGMEMDEIANVLHELVYLRARQGLLATHGRIMEERRQQDAKWGADRMLDDKLWLAILVEEVGEVAKEILEARVGVDWQRDSEITQVAAVALAWMECIERRRKETSDAKG